MSFPVKDSCGVSNTTWLWDQFKINKEEFPWRTILQSTMLSNKWGISAILCYLSKEPLKTHQKTAQNLADHFSYVVDYINVSPQCINIVVYQYTRFTSQFGLFWSMISLAYSILVTYTFSTASSLLKLGFFGKSFYKWKCKFQCLCSIRYC